MCFYLIKILYFFRITSVFQNVNVYNYNTLLNQIIGCGYVELFKKITIDISICIDTSDISINTIILKPKLIYFTVKMQHFDNLYISREVIKNINID